MTYGLKNLEAIFGDVSDMVHSVNIDIKTSNITINMKDYYFITISAFEKKVFMVYHKSGELIKISDYFDYEFVIEVEYLASNFKKS